jgi:hypothetical protein
MQQALLKIKSRGRWNRITIKDVRLRYGVPQIPTVVGEGMPENVFRATLKVQGGHEKQVIWSRPGSKEVFFNLLS